MFRNYIKVAVRTLRRHTFYSVIKIAGLAVGIAASLLIAFFVHEDLSYDGFHRHKNRIARILTIDNAEGVKSKLVGVSYPGLAPAAVRDLPEVVNSVRILDQGRVPLRVGEQLISSEGTFRTESSFFEVFDFRLLSGTAKGILDEPRTVVLTQSLARKLFGDTDPVGKAIESGTVTFNVKGVMADPPDLSHLQFDMLYSITPAPGDSAYAQYINSFRGIGVQAYLLLDKPRDLEQIIPKLKQVADKNQGYPFFVPTLQPLGDVHLQSGAILFEQNTNKADGSNLYVLVFVAWLILLLASVNFMNLATAHASVRAKEVGLRKVVGAGKRQLVGQHLLESGVVVAVAFGLGVLLAAILLPLLNNAYQRHADFSLFLDLRAVTGVLGGLFLLGLLSGSYPAFVLASFHPAAVLKGAFPHSGSGIRLRQALVTLQFTVSIALMAGTGVVLQQMRYIRHKNLGFNREQVLTIPFKGQLAAGRGRTLQAELKKNANVLASGTASTKLGQQLGRTNIYPEGKPTETNYITSIMAVDESFLPTLGIQVLKGRNFSPRYPIDSLSSMIINQEMARLLGWPEPVGKTIRLQTGPDQYAAYTVVGLVGDFHFATIRHKVEPMFMLYSRTNGQLALKISPRDVDGTLAFVQAAWKRLNPETPFEYSFLDEDFANLYRSEQAFAAMFGHFTILALFIAVLGLFGLSAFTAEQRRKEIGIRRVLGAQTSNLLYLLSKDFVVLVLVAFVIATPVAWYLMDKWLTGFAYRTDLNLFLFAMAGLLAVGVALITVNIQALKAVRTNPILLLRNE